MTTSGSSSDNAYTPRAGSKAEAANGADGGSLSAHHLTPNVELSRQAGREGA